MDADATQNQKLPDRVTEREIVTRFLDGDDTDDAEVDVSAGVDTTNVDLDEQKNSITKNTNEDNVNEHDMAKLMSQLLFTKNCKGNENDKDHNSSTFLGERGLAIVYLMAALGSEGWWGFWSTE